MASPTPTHVSATPEGISPAMGTEKKRWLGDLDSPLFSTSSTGSAFADAVQQAFAPPPVSAVGTVAEAPRRRFVASPVRFPATSSPPPSRRRPAAASPVRFPSPPVGNAAESSRQAAARRPAPPPAAPSRAAPRVDADGFVQPHGRYYRRQNRRSTRPPSPPPPPPPPPRPRPVPADLWGLCFNCCRPGHMAADCWYPSRCLRCHEEGHRAADIALCMRDRSPPAAEDSRPAQRRRDCSPQAPRQPQPRRGSSPEPPMTILARHPPSNDQVTRGAPSRGGHLPTSGHSLPPPVVPMHNQVVSFPSAGATTQRAPPSLEQLMQHRPDHTLCYVRRSPTITEAESALADAVTIMIVGARPAVSRAQLADFVATRFSIEPDSFDVYDFAPEDFLVHFSNNSDRNRTLAASGILSTPTFKCTIKPWTRQAHARASTCHFRAVVDIYGIPPNASCLGTVSSILAPCSVFERVLTDRADRSKFRVAVWTLDPTTIPFSTILFVEEPSDNVAGEDEELRMLAYDISVKVREVVRVDGPLPPPPPPPPPPPQSDNRGNGGPRRSHSPPPRKDPSRHGCSSTSNSAGRYGRSGLSQYHRRQVVHIPSSSSSSSSSPSPVTSALHPPPSSTTSAAKATATRRRRRSRRGKKHGAGTARAVATSSLSDKPLQRWVVKSDALTPSATSQSKRKDPGSNEPLPSSHVDALAPVQPIPMQGCDTRGPPDPAGSLSLVVHAAQSSMQPPPQLHTKTDMVAADPKVAPPQHQFLVGTFLLSASIGPTAGSALDPPPPPRWDTSPEASTDQGLVLDLVPPTAAPPTQPPDPPAEPEKDFSTPRPSVRRHLDFEAPSWAVYSKRPKAPNISTSPAVAQGSCSRLKTLTSLAVHLLPRPAVRKARRNVMPENFIPRRSRRVQARGAGRTEGPSRSCTKAILLKLGICVEDDDRAAPSPAALARYEQQFRRIIGRNQIAALASLYGWELPTDEELQSQAAAVANHLVVFGRSKV
ncbi:hypothetical protein ACQ4PT_064134 [Festuca glaucescens]